MGNTGSQIHPVTVLPACGAAPSATHAVPALNLDAPPAHNQYCISLRTCSPLTCRTPARRTPAFIPALSARMQLLSLAVRHRRVGSHELNMESSRSHSIFTGGWQLWAGSLWQAAADRQLVAGWLWQAILGRQRAGSVWSAGTCRQLLRGWQPAGVAAPTLLSSPAPDMIHSC